jgi:hypothetical protein
MDRELVAGAESARGSLDSTGRSRFEPCLVAYAGVRAVPGLPAAEPGNSYENYWDSGGGTRTPDTRIMIPLL